MCLYMWKNEMCVYVVAVYFNLFPFIFEVEKKKSS